MIQSSNGWCLQLGLASSLVISGAIANSGDCTLAKIKPDGGTLKTKSFVVTPNVVVHGLLGDQINGGAIQYPNLFHSFQQFKLDAEGAFFTSPTGIKNIVGPMKGGSRFEVLAKPVSSSTRQSPPSSYKLRLISLTCHTTASKTGSDQIYLHVNGNPVGGPYIMKAGDEVNLNAVGGFSINDTVSVELLYQGRVRLKTLGLRSVSRTSLTALQFDKHRTAIYTLNYEVSEKIGFSN